MPIPTNTPPNQAPPAHSVNGAPGFPSQQGQPQPDATMTFLQSLQDPRRWIIRQAVPIFKPHERTDPATGKLIKVDLVKLERIAQNMARSEQGGVPIRMTLGHTEPGKPETQQPPIGGYYRNPRVQGFGPQGEPAIVVDEWLDPQYSQYRKNFPYRSAEYYDDSEQITGVALLTRDPFLDLGIVAMCRDGPQATHYSRASEIQRPKHYYFLTGEGFMTQPNQNGAPRSTPPPPQQQQGRPAGLPQQQPQPQQPPQYYDRQGNPLPYAGAAQWVGPPGQFPEETAAARSQQQEQSPVYTDEYGRPLNPQPEPTPYGARPQQYKSWPGPAHRPPPMHRQHPNHWAFARGERRTRYAEDGMPVEEEEELGMDGEPPPPGGMGEEREMEEEQMGMEPPGGGGLAEVAALLQQAAALISEHIGGGQGEAPQSPFPEEEMGGMTPGARYAFHPDQGHGGDWKTIHDPVTGKRKMVSGEGGSMSTPRNPENDVPTSMPRGQTNRPLYPPEHPGGDWSYARYADPAGHPQSSTQRHTASGSSVHGYHGHQASMRPREQHRSFGTAPSGAGIRGKPQPSSGKHAYTELPKFRAPPTKNEYAAYRAAMAARYRAPQSQQQRGRVPYNRGEEPMRTISGLPVRYQMELDKRDAMIRELNQAVATLYQERDQADTRECIAAIEALSARGYNVGEWEISELKKKPTNERAQFIQMIMSKYERGPGTEMAPTMYGDPTPGPAEDANRPLSREEMDMALKMKDAHGRPIDYTMALQYIRQNGGVNRITQYGAGGVPQQAPYATPERGSPEWYAKWGIAPPDNYPQREQADQAVQAQMQNFDPNNPYGEPSTNGDGYYEG